MKFRLRHLLFFIVVICISWKNKNPVIEVREFKALTNWPSENGHIHPISLDYTEAIDSGFVIPSIRQVADGNFQFEFSIRNNYASSKDFIYKIYYQNESYKFEELELNGISMIENLKATENFYGSWRETKTGFISTPIIPADNQFHLIKNTFSIVGNPRNEEKYFGKVSDETPIPDKDIAAKIDAIKNTPQWASDIQKKALANRISFETQLALDAVYILKEERNRIVFNQRWKRNPRVGNYKFLLVVSDKENIVNKTIPSYLQDISQKKGANFENPFYFFLYGPGKNIAGTSIVISDDILKVQANPDLGNGIYIKPIQSSSNKSSYTSNCDESYKQYRNAKFQQFFHHINEKEVFNNIPLQADVNGNQYTVEEYKENEIKYKKLPRINKPISISCCPCKTVKSDSSQHKIQITNPGNNNGDLRKENVGVISRNGFTYGKYRLKVKLASLLNKSLVWNGLTNAMWLIYQSGESWNERSLSKSGYIPKNLSGKDAVRSAKSNYSEIDFEILKTSKYWPASSYQKNTNIPHDGPNDVDKIIVSCTNWDLACRDAKKFGVGVKPIQYKNQVFDLHRWDDWYQALTSKYPEKDSELFDSPYYYFEIEWKPTEIIWRVGPEKNSMHEVGYMNSSVTNIPNNQMLMIISQEYHLAPWWPGSSFSQDMIPFPSKDITGEILGLEIE